MDDVRRLMVGLGAAFAEWSRLIDDWASAKSPYSCSMIQTLLCLVLFLQRSYTIGLSATRR